MNAWRAPVLCRRTGASHRRRRIPCQDSSARARLRSRDGLPVWVMAVADGHGGAAHGRSDVGSRLACAAAIRQVRRRLGCASLAAAGAAAEARRWREWLAEELPGAIHADWLARVRADWQRPAPSGPDRAPAAAFTPLPYGTTLGVVVLTPLWWGHTGLGDWDLVLVDEAGTPRLLSEEAAALHGPGDSTGSLCLADAPALCAGRSGLHPLVDPAGQSFTLVLSTDGVRKSCATDADFLGLAGWLAGATEGGVDLAAALDRISAEGSGDDVSVAIAAFGAAAVQPPPAPGGRQRRRSAPALAAALAAVAVAVALAARLRAPWSPAPDPLLVQQADELCGLSSEALAGTLASRRRQFDDLRRGTLQRPALLAAADRDPLGALIAASFDPRSGGMSSAGRPAGLRLCAALRQALLQRWRQPPLPSRPPPP